MLTISQIKALPNDADIQVPSIKAVVKDISAVEKKNDKGRFYVILADTTGSISATIYETKMKDKFIKGMGVLLVNVLIKTSYIAVTSKSEVAICQGFDIPPEVEDDLPQFPGHEASNIGKALESPEKSIISVKGKVVRVSII